MYYGYNRELRIFVLLCFYLGWIKDIIVEIKREWNLVYGIFISVIIYRFCFDNY